MSEMKGPVPPEPSSVPAQDWGQAARASVWINVVVQAVVLLALLVTANLLARKFPKRIDFTSRQAYTLSNLTEDMLRRLDYDVEIWVTTPTYAIELTEDKSMRVAYQRTLEVLEEFRKRSPRLHVRVIDPQDQAQNERFAKYWSQGIPNSLFFLATLGDGRTNKKTLELYQTYEGNALTGEITSYRGEAMIAQAILELGGATKRVFYESEGHGEYLTEDPRTLKQLGNFLSANEGVEFRRLLLQKFETVPLSCDVLMIMGPAQEFDDHEIRVLRDYLDRGGSLLVALRPRVKTRLEPFLEENGVRVGDNLVHDPLQFYDTRRSNLVVSEFSAHPINRGMSNLRLRIPDCCTVDTVEKRDRDWRIVQLARSGPNSWEATGPATPGVDSRPLPSERVGRLPLIVAVERPAPRAVDESRKQSKLLVWGSAAPFTNKVLAPFGNLEQVETYYIVNNFRWLAERELMKIEAKKIEIKPLDMSVETIGRLKWALLGGFPLLGVVLGFFAWFMRRK